MRGRGRPISTVLADALGGRPEARLAVTAAAFAEACGWPLAREVSVRRLTDEGCLIAVASSGPWADQLVALWPRIRSRMSSRLGREGVKALDVRVAPTAR